MTLTKKKQKKTLQSGRGDGPPQADEIVGSSGGLILLWHDSIVVTVLSFSTDHEILKASKAIKSRLVDDMRDALSSRFTANEAWRIFSSPDSLSAMIPKAKYFKYVDFLSATINTGYLGVSQHPLELWQGQGARDSRVLGNISARRGREHQASFFLFHHFLPLCGHLSWAAPPPSKLKLNNIVAICKNSSYLGVGATIKDDKIKVLATRSNMLIGSFFEEVGHFIALWEGLMLAKFYDFPVSIVETSFASVAYSLSCSNHVLSDVNFLVNDIKALFYEVGICKCQAIPKLGNSLEHNLASLAFSSVREHLWLDSNPSSIFSDV
ncbi:hypothetical protein Dsin_012759 [Dipteronia sinensis]|uniref:RNase H type-1 domain-containing protein n=1 Tax=Dipteronia sinensis TaxID=43782 RepID=A0AAE0AJW1_9ROSI|nr:hypothetical protein Dsin_012759 [Dipteronia sinensis]